MTKTKTTRAMPLLACASLCLLAACEWQNPEPLPPGTKPKAGRKVLMAGKLFSTPALDYRAAFYTASDGGAVDAGEGEPIEVIPPETVGELFLAQAGPDGGAFTALEDAQVSLSGGAAPVELEGQGEGGYLKSSLEDEAFGYSPGATYRFEAKRGASTYAGEPLTAPSAERVEKLHPPGPYFVHPKGAALTLTRTLPASGELPPAFVTVVPIDADGFRGEATYSSLPEPAKIQQLLASTAVYRAQSLTIPGSAFPAGETVYLVLFTRAELSTASAPEEVDGVFLAGVADVGVVRTSP